MAGLFEIGAAYLVGLACGACLVCFFVGANRQKCGKMIGDDE